MTMSEITVCTRFFFCRFFFFCFNRCF